MYFLNYSFTLFVTFIVSGAEKRPQKAAFWHSLWKVMKKWVFFTIFSIFSYFSPFLKLKNVLKKQLSNVACGKWWKISFWPYFEHFHVFSVLSSYVTTSKSSSLTQHVTHVIWNCLTIFSYSFTFSQATKRPQKAAVWHSLWKMMKIWACLTIFSIFSCFLHFFKINNILKRQQFDIFCEKLWKMSSFDHIFNIFIFFHIFSS